MDGTEPALATGQLHLRARTSAIAPEVAKDSRNADKERRYRTRSGRRWSGNTIPAIPRNRTYLGEIYYRGAWYLADDHHPATIEQYP